MSRKIKKKKLKPTPVSQKQAENKPKSKKKTVAVSIGATLIALAIVLGIVAIALNSQNSFDYMKEDLSRYLTLSESDYKGIDFDIKFKDTDESDVNRLINALLCKNKNKTPEYNGQNVINMPITLGDVAKIYYRGYTVDENGNETDFDSNLFSGKPKSLEIGSGSSVPGFEESLLNVVPKDYARSVNKISEGFVTVFDTVYLTYKAFYPDGTHASVSARRIDLRLPNLDKKYGIGFTNFLLGNGEGNSLLRINQAISGQKTFEMQNGGTAMYYDMKIEYVLRETEAPLTIDVRFPSTYHEPSLRGVDAKFDVYIDSVVFYETPEYNEAFITEVLKLSADKLNGYDGDSLLEKHKSMLFAEALANEEAQRKALFEELIWERLLSAAEIIKLPESEVESYYNSEYSSAYNTYTYYQSIYGSFDEFAKVYYRLSDGESWKEHITELAKETVRQKLIFHYILKNENLTPTGEEYERLYSQTVNDYLPPFIESHRSELDKCKTDEEYNKKIEEIKKEVIEYYGDDFFKASVYYNTVMEKLIKWSAAS